jgi:hypothetical protein
MDFAWSPANDHRLLSSVAVAAPVTQTIIIPAVIN